MKFKALRLWVESLANAVVPRYCIICERRLWATEECTCLSCLMQLPRTGFKGKKGNIVERILWDERITTQRGNSFLYYHPESVYCNIFFSFKYLHNPATAVFYGRMMAHDLEYTDFFQGIDLLVPVPLSGKRFLKRGYNQSERLAAGVSAVTGIPVCTEALQRVSDNVSQTRLTVEERRENVQQIFRLARPDLVAGKHVLLIDDVITTGSTIKQCAYCLLEAEGVKLSVLSLAISYFHSRHVFPHGCDPDYGEEEPAAIG